MIALLRKESEALAPYWLAFLVLCAANMGAILWDPDFVLDPLGERFSGGAENAGVLWILAFLVGHGAVAHELREGHVEFLDGLPISRASVYGAKLWACVLPVVALVLMSLGMDLLLAALARPAGALSPLGPVLVMHLVMLASGLAGLGSGMLLSWLGPLAWGLLALGSLIALCGSVLYPPLLGWLPMVGTLGNLEWHSTSASHPVAPPLCLSISGLVAMGLSGLLFLGPGRYLTERGSDVIAWVRGAALGCLALIVLPLGGLFWSMLVIEHAGELWQGTRALPSDGGGFRILHAPGDEVAAHVVASQVDALSAQVGELLGQRAPLGSQGSLEAGGRGLDIEVLGAPQNHLGVFTGGKIRLARGTDTDTLAHELAHAHAYALSGPMAWHQETHFFDEGLADWVQSKITGRDPVPVVVGAIHATGQARFEDLVERERHQARHDIRQSYALGQAFVAALVDVGGPAAPSCVLTELGKAGPRKVAGLALWYGLASRCGFDLDAVQDRWLQSLEEARARLAGPLPRLRASVVTVDGWPRIEVRDELELGWRLLCGFRDGPDAPVNRWLYQQAREGICEVPTAGLSGHTVQYQVGFRLPEGGEDGLGDVYLEWTDAPRFGTE
jgi:hypothetical protein